MDSCSFLGRSSQSCWRGSGLPSIVSTPASAGGVGYLYHCHLDVTPPDPDRARAPAWRWHQDGGRQNLDLDGNPRARMSLKVAYWLSDVGEPGRGNLLVVPGSHRRDVLERRCTGPGAFGDPPGARPILASPGDALVFDRRLWHSRSENRSGITRKVIFLAYTYRWVRPRDELGIDPASRRFAALSPVRRQLLGAPADPFSHWGLSPDEVPLRSQMERAGSLDAAIACHR